MNPQRAIRDVPFDSLSQSSKRYLFDDTQGIYEQFRINK